MEGWIELQARLSTGERVRIDNPIVERNLGWIDQQIKQGCLKKSNPIWCDRKQMLIDTIQFTQKVGEEAKELAKIKLRDWP